MQRLYETIKLFSFPFLTLKRNAKKATKRRREGGIGEEAAATAAVRREEGEQKGNYILRRRKYASRRRTRERRQKYYFPVTLGFVSVAMAHPLHYSFWPCCCLKVLRLPCPPEHPLPHAREAHPKACGLLFALLCLCECVVVWVCECVCAQLLRLIRVRNFYEKMPASSTWVSASVWGGGLFVCVSEFAWTPSGSGVHEK